MAAAPIPPPDEEEAQTAAPAEAGAAPPDQGGSGGMMPADDEGAGDETGAADEEEPAGGGQKATPEQQAQYEKFIDNGLHLIYAGGKVNPGILKSLSSGDPVRALGMTAVSVVMRLLQSAKQHGAQLDYAVELHGGQALFMELANLSGKAKIHKYSEDELSKAWVFAMGLAAQQMKAAGLLDPAAFQREVQEMNAAQQDGKLDEVWPGMADVLKKIGPIDVPQQGAAPAGAAPPQQQQPAPVPAGSGGLG